MTVRNGRSRGADVGSGPSSKDGKGHKEAGSGSFEWGLGSKDNEEDIFLRRALFVALVVVVVCVGGWFMLTTASGNKPILSANARPAVHTVRLLDFPAANRAQAMKLATVASKASLAPESEFYALPLSDGKMALCVGKFDDVNAPRLQDLVRTFRNYSADGFKPFATASVYTYSK